MRRHDAPRADDRPAADRDAGQDDGARSDPHVVLDADRRRELRAVAAYVGVDGVAGRGDGHVRREHDPVADEHFRVVDEREPEVDVDVVAEVHVAAVGDVQRRLDPDPLAQRAEQLAQDALAGRRIAGAGAVVGVRQLLAADAFLRQGFQPGGTVGVQLVRRHPAAHLPFALIDVHANIFAEPRRGRTAGRGAAAVPPVRDLAANVRAPPFG